MEYSIRELSEIAGISARTLRYYDKIGLLKPSCVRESGYRSYGETELELLQQILFYKERGLKLEQIAAIIQSDDFDVMAALHEHLEELELQQARLDNMITAVKKTIASMKGEIIMSNAEKFESFKTEMIKSNEEKYGDEIRRKYGENAVEESNKRMLNMTEEEYSRMTSLEEEIREELNAAVKAGESPEGEKARHIVGIHKEWLGMNWKQYTPKAHIGITEMYVADPRFTEYYDKDTAGCAEFLKKAVFCWAERG